MFDHSFFDFISITERMFPKSRLEKVLFYIVVIGLVIVSAEITAFTLYYFNQHAPMSPENSMNELHYDAISKTLGVFIKVYAILILARLILIFQEAKQIEEAEERVYLTEDNLPFAFDGHLQEYLPLEIVLDTLRYFKVNPKSADGTYYDAESGTFSAIGRILLNIGKYHDVNSKIETLIRTQAIRRSDFKPKYRLNRTDIFVFMAFYTGLQTQCDDKNNWKEAYELTVPNYNELSDQGVANFYYNFLHEHIARDFSEFKEEVHKVYSK